MNKQSLEERIAKVAHATAVESRKNTGDRYSKLKTVTVKLDTKALKQLLKDVLTEVLPEKLPKPTISDDICERYCNHAIDQTLTNLNNLLGEK